MSRATPTDALNELGVFESISRPVAFPGRSVSCALRTDQRAHRPVIDDRAGDERRVAQVTQRSAAEPRVVEEAERCRGTPSCRCRPRRRRTRAAARSPARSFCGIARFTLRLTGELHPVRLIPRPGTNAPDEYFRDQPPVSGLRAARAVHHDRLMHYRRLRRIVESPAGSSRSCCPAATTA